MQTREFDPAIRDPRIRDFYAVRSGAPPILGAPGFLQDELTNNIRWDYECAFLGIINPLLARMFPRLAKGYDPTKVMAKATLTPEPYDALGRKKPPVRKRLDDQDGKMTWEGIARMTDAKEIHAMRRHHLNHDIAWPRSSHAMFTAIINFRLGNLVWPEETLWSLEMRERTRMAYQPPRSEK